MPEGLRDRFLRLLAGFGLALVILTEGLGAFHAIHRGPLLAGWAIAALILAGIASRKPIAWPKPRFDLIVALCCPALAGIFALTAMVAIASPPNSADAMAYHMPRVVYWAEQASVRFFPTEYLNQIMLQPLAEYAMLHLYVITGGDRWINLVQWFASVACAIGVSSVAAKLGFSTRGQAIAALFCATIPSGVLASTGAKNDYWLAIWLVATVYFALSYLETARWADAALGGIALGLALLTKATAYLFLPWILLAIFAGNRKRTPRRWLPQIALAAALAVLLNSPLFLRNYQLSGSILGFDSAQGDGFFRWRNDTLGWKPTASNVLRNFSDQMGARSERWNQGVYQAVLLAHRHLGIDVNDPATTWRWSSFTAPKNSNHEADAPSRWHLLLILAVIALFCGRALRGRFPGSGATLALYGIALICGFVFFCAYLKWQPFLARLFLPWFVLGSPLIAVIGDFGKSRLRIAMLCLQLFFCWFLVDTARHALIENWVRPLKGPSSVLRTPRDDQYFADMHPWNNQHAFIATAELLARSDCGTIGIDIYHFQLEYPLQALLRERNPAARFVHAGVGNLSARYPLPVTSDPCAIVCLDCAGDEARIQKYAAFPERVIIGKFVILRRRPVQ